MHVCYCSVTLATTSESCQPPQHPTCSRMQMLADAAHPPGIAAPVAYTVVQVSHAPSCDTDAHEHAFAFAATMPWRTT